MDDDEEVEDNRSVAEVMKAEWMEFPPSLQASSEGKTVSLNLLLARAVEFARGWREKLGDTDPSLETVLLIVLLSSTFQEVLEPVPPPEVTEILAAAAVRIMHLEDALQEVLEGD